MMASSIVLEVTRIIQHCQKVLQMYTWQINIVKQLLSTSHLLFINSVLPNFHFQLQRLYLYSDLLCHCLYRLNSYIGLKFKVPNLVEITQKWYIGRCYVQTTPWHLLTNPANSSHGKSLCHICKPGPYPMWTTSYPDLVLPIILVKSHAVFWTSVMALIFCSHS